MMKGVSADGVGRPVVVFGESRACGGVSAKIFENTVSLSVNHSAAHLVAQYCWHFTIKLPITIVSNYNRH